MRGTAAALLAVACLLPLVPRPLPVTDAPAVPQFFRAEARALPGEPVLVTLPYPTPVNPSAMRWQSQADYDFRMPGGYFLGPAGDGHAYVGGDADPATARLLAGIAENGQPVAITPADREQVVRDLRDWQADAVVLGPVAMGTTGEPEQVREALRQTVADLLGQEPELHGDTYVWWTRRLWSP